MNNVILMGRLTRDPEVRSTNGDNPIKVANYRLAVNRRFKREGQADADFFDCTSFGKQAEFTEKYLHQGTKVVISGRLQNDNYTDKEGRQVWRNTIIIENVEFAESKAADTERRAAEGGGAQTAGAKPQSQAPQADTSGFMDIPDGIEEELPFM